MKKSMNNLTESKFKKYFSLLLAISISLLTVIPSFAATINDNSNNLFENDIEKNVSVNNEMKDINILKTNDNYVEYTFKKDNELYLAKEYIKLDFLGESSVKSEFFKIEDGNVDLIKTQETQISKENNKVNILEYDENNNFINEEITSLRNLTDNIIQLENLNSNESSEFRTVRKPIKYGVYVYNRTIRGYRNISLKKTSVGVLATAIASLSGGPVSAFFGISSYLIGSSVSEVWTITKVYHKRNKNLKHRTKFVMSLYSNSSRTKKIGPTVSYIEKGIR